MVKRDDYSNQLDPMKINKTNKEIGWKLKYVVVEFEGKKKILEHILELAKEL